MGDPSGSCPPPPPTRIAVHVQTSSGTSVEGATVSVEGKGWSGVTDTGGNFDFGEVPPDTYTVKSEKDSFSPASQTQTVASASSIIFTLSVTPCSITSETIAASPADRSRKKIGIGEEVKLTVAPGPATWSIRTGTGTLSSPSGLETTFTAPDRAASVQVQAVSPSGCTSSVTFDVIEPTGLLFEKSSNLKHTNGRPDCGFLAMVYVQPDSVSFYKVEIRELNSKATLTGFYNILAWRVPGIQHQPVGQLHSAWLPIGPPVAGKGSPGVGWKDQIYSGDPGGTPAEGTMTFPITWEYHVGSGTEKAFPGFQQTHHVEPSGKCTSSKDGESQFRVLTDATSGF